MIKKIEKYFKGTSFGKIIFFALLIRVILVPLSFHSDLNNNSIWGIYAKEFGLRGFYDWLHFGYYARPDYPPLAMIIFLVIRILWQFLFNFLWILNVSFGYFPSNLIPWFESKGYLSLLKLPGVFADLGIGYLIYNFIKEKQGVVKGKEAASLFLFNLPIIYLSSSWGQLDSVVGFFGLLSLILIIKKKYLTSFTYFFICLMIKVTMMPMSIVLLIKSLKDRISFGKVLTIIITFFSLSFIIGYIFIDGSYVIWLIRTYYLKFIPGAATIPYLNLNAFNFWGFAFGLNNLPDDSIFMGVKLSILAWSLALFFLFLIHLKYLRNQNIFFTALMIFFTTFMFLPRVHERYLYPIFIFFPFILLKYSYLNKYFVLLSAIFLFNLYHRWWVPPIPSIMTILSNPFIERGISFVNFSIYILMLKNYFIREVKEI